MPMFNHNNEQDIYYLKSTVYVVEESLLDL